MKIVASKPTITRKELEGVLDCLIQDTLASGAVVKQFEQALASLLSIKYSVATNSVTAAYHCAFVALGIGAGDEIIMPSFFHEAPLKACLLVGAKPVLVDIAEGMYHPSKEAIIAAITHNTKAIVVGHMFGIPLGFDMGDSSVPVILDISHAIGMDTSDIFLPVPSIAVASFTPSMMITTEMGAMVFTNNSRYFSTMRDVRSGVPHSHILGFEYCMSDLHAAVGLNQLLKLKDFVKRRRDIARIYYDALHKTHHATLYAYNEHCTYQAFPVLFDAQPDIAEKFFKKNGIEIFHPVEVPLHQYCKLRNLDYPHSDRLSKKLFSLPIYPTLTKREIEKVSKVLTMFA
ncbi:MAG: DegT/DnrJ/EryC1/StrS aminotransferase family protein [Spirochaetes bacterium]|nr:DegT/DnrJ/EryC1/StrS aminotransferase family protein [Spirochaetota bacterium]